MKASELDFSKKEEKVLYKNLAFNPKAFSDNYFEILNHFRVGEVVQNWFGFDKVIELEFDVNHWGQLEWEVTVISCDESGNPLNGEINRKHSTRPYGMKCPPNFRMGCGW